jgi:uncharacterized protein (DUF58 family)
MADKKAKFSLIPNIKKLEINTRLFATGTFIGNYRSSFKGKGVEFDSYRSYMPDDDANMIDWKATARSDDVLVKQFVEERNLRVFLLVDVSSSMLYGSSEGKLKIIYAAELAASLCYAILRAKDSVGYGLFSDRVINFSMPSLESNQFYRFCSTLVDTNNYGGGYDLEVALGELFGILPDRTVLVIISDFIGLMGNWEQKLTIAGKKFEVIGIMLRDVFDRTLPSDEINLLVEDPYSAQQVLVNPVTMKKNYELHSREEEDYIKSAFKRSNGDLLVLQTDKSFVKPLVTFFKLRERKWR